jgi:hypothetical protein
MQHVSDLIDTACPVCGERPGIAGQQIGDRRYAPGCVTRGLSGEYRPKTQAEHGFRERRTDAWHRELQDDRAEIMCKAPGFRIRVTAPREQAWEAVELFEKWTGLTITFAKRPPRRQSVPAGQLTMTELEGGSSDG